MYLGSFIEIIEDRWHEVVSHINSSAKSDVKKLDTKVVQMAEAVKKQETMIK